MSLIKIISFITFFIIFFSNLTFSQGLIKLENNKCILGKVNKFYYTPPKQLTIPTQMEAVILFNNGIEYSSFTSPLIKSKQGLYFLFKVPNAATVLLLGIVNPNKREDDLNGLIIPRKEIVDNNNEKGYFINTNTRVKPILPVALVKAELLQSRLIRLLWLSKPDEVTLLKWFTNSYQIDQSLKKRDSYIDYLELAYEKNPKKAKQEIISKINDLNKEINNEESLQTAIYLYDLLQMDAEKAKLESFVVSKFPNGDLAKEKHWQRFYKTKYYDSMPNERLVLDSLNYYTYYFKDTTSSTKDIFYNQILELAFNNRNWELFKKYRNIYLNKSKLSWLDRSEERRVGKEC